MDVDPEFVDQIVVQKGGGHVRATEREVSTGLGLELHDLGGDDFPENRGVPVGAFQGSGEDDLGMSRQMPANSAKRSVLDGSASALGQNPAMSS